MVEIQRIMVAADNSYEYRFVANGKEPGNWHHTEAQAMFEYVCSRLEDLSKRVCDLEAKANG